MAQEAQEGQLLTKDTNPPTDSTAVIIPEPTQFEEEFNISPEHLEFAKCYLSTLDLNETAKLMRLDLGEVTKLMRHRDVRAVIDNAFLDQGYMNRGKISTAMTTVINAKLAEMEETELVSGKDISELLQMAHKMRTEEMKLQIKIAELEVLKQGKGPKTAIQVNNLGTDAPTNYSNLLQQIVSGGSSE